ncbi:spore germination protein [Paenibacillus kobensis]|uniref:spore germination protein n=1 Tax=Paenibacillus kobensis TaxID=59841 RepID=UPI0027D7D65D|nr:spore germination protein [Paenibacillus kobensis]
MASINHQSAFSDRLDLNIKSIQSIMGESSDLIVREITVMQQIRLALIFLDGMVEKHLVQDSLISAILDRVYDEMKPVTVHYLKESIIASDEVQLTASREEAMDQLLSGSVLVLLDHSREALAVSLPGWEDRAITESKAQPVVRGPQQSFTESLHTNTTLVRRRVKDVRVRVQTIPVGSMTKTDITIMYVQGIAGDQLIRQLTERLRNSQLEKVLEGEYIEEWLLKDKPRTIFPLLYNTDRPDVIAAGILDGKAAIFIDGSPFVLLAPSLFADFMQSAEDYYESYIYSSLIRMLRYLSLFICMFAPAIYIALTTYHQDMLPTQLLLSLAAQREGVPFPAFIEAVLMEVTFEILREAGIRMPRTIGQAVSIVGTIVIGQAAVEASIVSAAMVIVLAITAISNFVIPSYSMSIAIRILRFIFMGLAAAFGAFGLTIGIIVLVIHLCGLQSFGVPYMRPYAPYKADAQKDALVRLPYRLNTKRSRQRS